MSSGYDRRKLNVYKGQIGEMLARIHLMQQGFEVMNYEFLISISKHLNSKFITVGTEEEFHVPSIDSVKKFLGSRKKDLLELKEALNTIYSGETHRKRRFDFIAKKEGAYYVVEIKTNEGRLTEPQKKELELSKKFGFIPIVIRTKVKIIADLKDVKLEFL